MMCAHRAASRSPPERTRAIVSAASALRRARSLGRQRTSGLRASSRLSAYGSPTSRASAIASSSSRSRRAWSSAGSSRTASRPSSVARVAGACAWPAERLLEQRHGRRVVAAVELPLRERERGAHERLVVAGGAREIGGLARALAALLEVAGARACLRRREQQLAALPVAGELGEVGDLERPVEVLGRLGVGVDRGRLARRLGRGRHCRLGRRAAARGDHRVMGDLGGSRSGARRRREPRGHGRVHARALADRQAAVEHVADRRVHEREAARATRDRVDQALGRRRLERAERRAAVAAGEPRRLGGGELAAEHRRHGEQVARRPPGAGRSGARAPPARAAGRSARARSPAGPRRSAGPPRRACAPISATKNGLPPVRRAGSPRSRPLPRSCRW